jgi:hypothetical protein
MSLKVEPASLSMPTTGSGAFTAFGSATGSLLYRSWQQRYH